MAVRRFLRSAKSKQCPLPYLSVQKFKCVNQPIENQTVMPKTALFSHGRPFITFTRLRLQGRGTDRVFPCLELAYQDPPYSVASKDKPRGCTLRLVGVQKL